MPNHITNELTAPIHVLDDIAGINAAIDFNKIIPMPKILSGESATPALEEQAKSLMGFPLDDFELMMMGRAKQPKDLSEDEFETLIRYMRALKTTGYTSWYGWSIDNWGTKWNAYEAKRVADDKITFQTAWSAPLLVVKALSSQHPEHTFTLRWADEDYGSNAGSVVVKGGEIIEGGDLENGSREAYDLAIELIYGGVLPDDMRREEDGSISCLDEDEIEDDEVDESEDEDED